MSAKLLSSLVQTKSIEFVLAPIASQVSQVILLNEAAQRDGVPLPDLVSSAQQIREAIKSLILAAQALVSETTDDDLKSEMPPACDSVTKAGDALLKATHQLKQQPFSSKVRYNLVDSARNILEGTMKASRDYVVGQIMLACTEIIKTVEARDDLGWSVDEPGYMAATLEKAHKQLSPHSRLEAGNDLDSYLDAIVRSSMGVANTCEGERRDRIVQACQSA
ncbi:hypothetical protein pdam_00015030 [Pocillopora damicornis]|uniref:Vinculin n=1 Tax=Pocillopora damicornis TaxID=46731 RepID=A0A3M6TRP9_POCDA|nr:hypothetical protein pdam_00015030 [Pocillopora damicornis]